MLAPFQLTPKAAAPESAALLPLLGSNYKTLQPEAINAASGCSMTCAA